MGLMTTDLNKKQREIDGMMKELTHRFEVNKPAVKISGTPTEVSADVDAFQLNPARKTREYYGNKVYVDRVKIEPNVEFRTLERICHQMVEDYFSSREKYELYLMSFKVSEKGQEWCRQTEIGDLEIRLICKFEETA